MLELLLHNLLTKIIRKKNVFKMDKERKKIQLIKRGRYVEFNLLI